MQSLISVPKFSLRSWLMSLWLPLGLLVIGYFVATSMVDQQQQTQAKRISDAVTVRLNLIAEGVQEKVTLYQYGLRGIRGAVMLLSPEHFDYNDMQAYTQVRDYKREFPGAHGFGLIIKVEPNQTAAFLDRMAAERPSYNFQIRQLTPHQDSLFVITYIEPEQKNREAVGVDIGSEAMRRKAALDAAFNNDVRLTAPITLVQANERAQQGFLMLMPVYKTTTVPQDSRQRLEHLFGWSYAPILINEVLNSVAGLENDVFLQISDITEQTPIEFFSQEVKDTYDAALQHKLNLSVFGRQWQLSLTPTNRFINELQLRSGTSLFFEVMAVSTILAFGVYLLQLMLMRRSQLIRHKQELASIAEQTLLKANAELEQQVALRTAEISRVNILQRSIFSSAGYAIIATDEEGIITAFNPAAEKLLGYRAEEVLFQQTPSIFHLPAEVEHHAAKLTTELGSNIAVGFETLVAKARLGQTDNARWTYLTKTGEQVQVKLTVSALKDEQGQLAGFLGIAFDLTKQLKYEAELAQAKEQAESANKAKSEFLANMSHEIRTPMNGVLGLLQLVANSTLDQRQADYIEKAYSAAKSLLTLLNDILDFSKIEAGKLELDPHPFSLTDLLQDIGLVFSSSAEQKGLEVLYDVTADVPEHLLGDSFRIKQVLINLVGNAIKFTDKGEILISIRSQSLPEGEINLSFSIKDTGIGITLEQQNALFSGFQQADSSISRRYGGTGLGLAISKRLVNLMGGEIGVESEFGCGSTFSFNVVVRNAEKRAIQNSQTFTRSNEKLSVLIVDDNDSSRIILQGIAVSLGWQAKIASDAQEASLLVKQAHRDSTRYDVVFVDWRMPGKDGLTFARELRELHSSVVSLIVMITAHGKELLDEHNNDYERYLDGFLIKPVTKNTMLQAVESVVFGDLDLSLPTSPLPHELPLQGISLLLVEDNLTNQLVASELLQQLGATIKIASSGEEALEMLESTAEHFDMVLMDIQMPGMDGYQTTREIRKLPRHQLLPIIAITAHAMSDDIAACLAAGMQDHIAKPFDLNELTTKILSHHKAEKAPHVKQVNKSNLNFDQAALAFCQQHHIELEAAVQRLGYSLTIYVNVLKQFEQDLRQALQQLEDKTLTRRNARLLFHSLKGAAGTLGFSNLAKLTARLEDELREHSDDGYQVDNNVLDILKLTLNTATDLVKLLQVEQQIATAQAPVSRTEQAAQLMTLKQHLNLANMAALPLYQQLAPSLQAQTPELNKELEEALVNLAFEQAVVIVDKMLSQFKE